MELDLFSLFDGLLIPKKLDHGPETYAAIDFPNRPGCYIVKDDTNAPHVMISSPVNRENEPLTKIRLKDLEVFHDIKCTLSKDGAEISSNFTDIQCLSDDKDIIFFFLYACDNILSLTSEEPSRSEISTAVMKLASLFEKSKRPRKKSLSGLFGELFVIHSSACPDLLISSWRVEDSAVFDFSNDSFYLEVKTTSGKERSHIFSYEQCNPPKESNAIVASLFVEESSKGCSLLDLVKKIEARISSDKDLLFKLRDNIHQSLGALYAESKDIRFDLKISHSTLKFYDIFEIPALRDVEVPGLSNIHFKANLSFSMSLSKGYLEKRNLLL